MTASRGGNRFATAIVVAVLLPALGAGVTWGLRGLAIKDRDEVRRQNGELRFQLERVSASPGEDTAPATAPWLLWEQADAPGVMQRIQDTADTAGVAIDDVGASPAAAIGKQSFRVVGHGDPRAVCAFLAAIERQEALLVVETGRVTPHVGERLGFEIGIAAWHRGGEAR